MEAEGPYSNASRKRAHEDSRRREDSHYRDPASVQQGSTSDRRGGSSHSNRPYRGRGRGRGRPYRGRGGAFTQNVDQDRQRDEYADVKMSDPPRIVDPADVEEGELLEGATIQQAPEREPEADVDFDALVAQSSAQPDPETLREEKRKRRAALLAQYSASTPADSPLPVASPLLTGSTSATPGLNSPAKRLRLDSPATRDGTESPDQQAKFDLVDLEKHEQPTANPTNTDENISAADYNPDEDRREDDARQLRHRGEAGTAGQAGATAVAAQEVLENDEEAEDEEEDDEDDMFAIDAKPKKVKSGKKKASGMVVIDRGTTAAAPIDDQDDAEGYYRVILGELLDDGRYHVHGNLGKGMFSSVVKAKDTLKDGKEVAIKIIRSQESMYKAGQKEAAILRRLAEADPHDKKHIVRMDRVFEHRKHLCLVFESLSMNLREVVRKFGKDVGINLKAVRAYAHQMFLGLNLMRKINIMHADIKPDNMLVNESHSQLKISDLGSASDTSENDITPYLVSRFYRAPEIILGLPYDCSLDTWSIGCTLYELYTGKILFPGRNNNQMLLHIQEVKGKLSNKFIKKGRFTDMHFDESGAFLSSELNKTTGTESVKKLTLSAKPVSDIRSRIMTPAQVKKLSGDEAKLLASFVDLLEKTLDLDPAKRIQPKDALLHPFLR